MVWLAVNSLTVNISETKFISFASRIASLPQPSPTIEGNTCASENREDDCACLVVNVRSIKYLGLHLDNCLSWKVHIQAVSSCHRKLIFLFKQLRLSAHKDILNMVYTALCKSISSYYIAVWSGVAKSSMIQVESAQRTLIKILPNIFSVIQRNSYTLTIRY